MSRTHTNDFTVDSEPSSVSGYDYRVGAWVLDGFYCSCAHPEWVDCACFGRDHASERVPASSFPDIH